MLMWTLKTKMKIRLLRPLFLPGKSQRCTFFLFVFFALLFLCFDLISLSFMCCFYIEIFLSSSALFVSIFRLLMRLQSFLMLINRHYTLYFRLIGIGTCCWCVCMENLFTSLTSIILIHVDSLILLPAFISTERKMNERKKKRRVIV